MKSQIRLRILAAVFAVAGISHFIVPGAFESIVPSWVPAPRAMVYISGVAEIAGAVGLLVTSLRVYAGWGLIALLIAVFPANINMLQMARDANAPGSYQMVLWMRLPLQPLLIWLVWTAAILPHKRETGRLY
ncbi:MAG: hypothetical protein ACO1Q7_17690 [Gemmatimonas sp.]